MLEVDLLKASLLDFWHQLGELGTCVLLGGGYGLYLKQQQITLSGGETLVAANLWPEPRATQDLDLLLTAEVVGDVESMRRVREILDVLGYVVVPGSEYLQFERTLAPARRVKIDLLTVQLDVLRGNPAIRADERRARPQAIKDGKLHAHPTDGALGLDVVGELVEIESRRTDGMFVSVKVPLPHAFSYLLMKLTAYRDRKADPDKDLGRHHALDIFRIVAMLTEAEFFDVRKYVALYAGDPQVQSCSQVVARDFQQRSADGIRAMRGHALWRSNDSLNPFFDALREIFRL